MKIVSNIFFFAAGLLLLSPQQCQAKNALRGLDDNEALLEAVSTLMERVTSLERERNELTKRVEILEEEMQVVSSNSQQQERRKLQDNSCIAEDNRSAGRFVIANCNLFVQSGGGTTDSLTGKGNVILGYNEEDHDATVRTGSHNLVIGTGHAYRQHSGIVAGRSNQINGIAGIALGGTGNAADGAGAVIIGGQNNLARAATSTVVGGEFNTANGLSSTAVGGGTNTATGEGSVVMGAKGGNAFDPYSVVVGG